MVTRYKSNHGALSTPIYELSDSTLRSFKTITNLSQLANNSQGTPERTAPDQRLFDLLKEYRNRWFVLGVREEGQPILTLALDRIKDLEDLNVFYVEK